MKGEDIIKFIQDNNLEKFDLKFSFLDGFGFNGFPNHRSFEITGVEDVGYSDKVIKLGGEEI